MGTRNYRWVKVPNPKTGAHRIRRRRSPAARSRVEFYPPTVARHGAGQNIQPAPSVLNTSRSSAASGAVDRIPVIRINIPPMERQYREPNSVAKRWIASAWHVALTYKHGTHPRKVTGVKVYLIEHLYPSPAELGTTHDERGKELAPRKLNDPTHYLPTYLGEFDAEGKMKPECLRLDVDGRGNLNKYDVNQRDPYLYWVIPILYHGVATGDSNRSFMYRDVNVDNFMKKHAGDPDWEDQTWENQP